MTEPFEDQDGAPEEDDDTGPNITSPDLAKWRARRERLHGRRRKLFDYLYVPAEVPEIFTESVKDLVNALSSQTGDPARALAEAQAYYDDASARIDSAERRATTLQGTVAITTTLIVAGAGLLLDASKVPDRGWRIALTVVLAVFVIAFLGCAVRALSVTTRMYAFLVPGWKRIPIRAGEPAERADLFRAAELLRAGAVASEVGDIKVGLLRAAAWWMRLGLLILALFAGLLVALAIAGPTVGKHAPSTSVTRTLVSTRTVVQTQTVTAPATVTGP